MKTPKTRTLIVITIISTVISFSLIAFHVRDEYRNLLGSYNEECNMFVAPIEKYIKNLKYIFGDYGKSNPYYTSIQIQEISIAYKERAIPYQMILADCFGDTESCWLFYNTIIDFYDSFGRDIPQPTMDYAIALLKKGAEDYTINEAEYNPNMTFAARCCCDDLEDIFLKGEYVPRDTILANYYHNLEEELRLTDLRLTTSDK